VHFPYNHPMSVFLWLLHFLFIDDIVQIVLLPSQFCQHGLDILLIHHRFQG
jgi:hypothetical protein